MELRVYLFRGVWYCDLRRHLPEGKFTPWELIACGTTRKYVLEKGMQYCDSSTGGAYTLTDLSLVKGKKVALKEKPSYE